MSKFVDSQANDVFLSKVFAMVFTSCSFAPEETKCSMQVEIIEGLRKHRKVTLRAEETHELQVVAWRLQEMGACGGTLVGRT